MERLSFSDMLASGLRRKEKTRKIAASIRSAGSYKWVGIYDVNDYAISLVGCEGKPEPAFTSFPKDKGLNGRAVQQGKVVIVNDIDADEDYLLTFVNTQSEIIVPIIGPDGKSVLGTIDAESEEKNAFSEADADFLEDCARSLTKF